MTVTKEAETDAMKRLNRQPTTVAIALIISICILLACAQYCEAKKYSYEYKGLYVQPSYMLSLMYKRYNATLSKTPENVED